MRLLEPPIEALGFELLELEFAQAGRGGTLRIYIDRRARAASRRSALSPIGRRREAVCRARRISVDDCAAVSHP